jgi:hypothetical protein
LIRLLEQSESSGVAERSDNEKDESGEDRIVNVSEKKNTTTQQIEPDSQTKSNKKSNNKQSLKSRPIHKSSKESSMKVPIQRYLHFINHTMKFDIFFLTFV